MIMKTFSLKKENIERQWYVVDASDKVLGRLSTKIADRIGVKISPLLHLILTVEITWLLLMQKKLK